MNILMNFDLFVCVNSFLTMILVIDHPIGETKRWNLVYMILSTGKMFVAIRNEPSYLFIKCRL